MIEITQKEKCCGCTACASICPHQAITMNPDSMGFLYPKVNKNLCTDCGLCERVCAFHPNYDISQNLSQPIAYGVRHKKMSEIESSRSGAAFIALSDWILNQNGVIYGAGYTDHFRVVHKRATTSAERNEFKGSKYVQSDLTGIFPLIKEDLKNGKIVLFSGTPCQTAGLKSYIPKRLQENLYLIDIICHGVPSPYIWRDYLKMIEQKVGKEVIAVDFRNKKDFGWAAHKETFYFSKKQITTTAYKDIFFKHVTIRQACNHCHYANIKRPSDITIGDFWGWQKTDANFNADDRGCSLVFCNTEKGREWFQKIQSEINQIPAKIENCLQPNLIKPSSISPLRNKFEKDYIQYGIEYVTKKYTKISLLQRSKQKIKRIIKKLLS
jgi:coenzyme F420-reducing hydrogenase beta subunit